MRSSDLRQGSFLLFDVVGWFVCQRSCFDLRAKLRHMFARRHDVFDERRVLFASLQRRRNLRNAMRRQRFFLHERRRLLLGSMQQQHLRRADLLP